MASPFEHILYEKKGRIAYVTVNRPQRDERPASPGPRRAD